MSHGAQGSPLGGSRGVIFGIGEGVRQESGTTGFTLRGNQRGLGTAGVITWDTRQLF